VGRRLSVAGCGRCCAGQRRHSYVAFAAGLISSGHLPLLI
jgi:hypothetical protein